ncbi:hypothetical protein [Dysgonomonas sp. 25]|uniref:hypothetical protein n=1 Tax=Dysgonomonas sp. 25 TaxID=2302933 RepID=UPI0013D72A36|nr:hypothetical protein [Dysgonomonas sp. 25]NDV69314.1 hypothetical protein [Dysgonomonas sp. 25]
MRTLYLLFFLLICSLLKAQEPTVFIKNRGYVGYIFPKEYFVPEYEKIEGKRYTPNIDEIHLAESILRDSIDVEMEKYLSHPYLLNGEPRLTRKMLNKYKRQYAGYLTDEGDVIIWINLLRNKEISMEALGSEIIGVLDGGSDYWNIYINITKRKLFGMHINGIG